MYRVVSRLRAEENLPRTVNPIEDGKTAEQLIFEVALCGERARRGVSLVLIHLNGTESAHSTTQCFQTRAVSRIFLMILLFERIRHSRWSESDIQYVDHRLPGITDTASLLSDSKP